MGKVLGRRQGLCALSITAGHQLKSERSCLCRESSMGRISGKSDFGAQSMSRQRTDKEERNKRVCVSYLLLRYKLKGLKWHYLFVTILSLGNLGRQLLLTLCLFAVVSGSAGHGRPRSQLSLDFSPWLDCWASFFASFSPQMGSFTQHQCSKRMKAEASGLLEAKAWKS